MQDVVGENNHPETRMETTMLCDRTSTEALQKASEPKNGKRGKSLNTHHSPRGQCTDGNMQLQKEKCAGCQVLSVVRHKVNATLLSSPKTEENRPGARGHP